MNINEVLYFAPDIPYNRVDWSGKNLPEQLCRRVESFYLDPAICCVKSGHAFAAGLLLVACIDALARLKYRNNEVGKRFTLFLSAELLSFDDKHLTQQFYSEVRNGLVHEARLKNGAQFTLDSLVGKTIDRRGGILLINPEFLLAEVQNALNSYVSLLKQDPHELHLLSSLLSVDLDRDILASNQYGT